jgi:uncharacterized delta-60 repeat protein
MIRTTRQSRRWRLLVPMMAMAALAWPGLTPVLHAADGMLDPTFGSGGKVTTDFDGRADQGADVAIQADGKIVVVGWVVTFPEFDFGVARYNPDGSLDTTFGTGGKVITEVNGQSDIATAVAIQADGKIVVAGRVSTPAPTFQDFAVVRYNSDGTLDTTFGTGGKVITDFNNGLEEVNDMLIQSDGKIVVMGRSFFAFSDIAIARYNTDGSLDTTFDGDGKVSTDIAFGSQDDGRAIAIQSDGKLVVVGSTTTGFPTPQSFAVLRYETDGSLDASFGVGGVVTTNFAGGNDAARGVAIQSDGRIVVAGQVTNPGPDTDFGVARYNTDGTLDATFGTGGLATTSIFTSADLVKDVALQADGKIIVVGDTSPPSSSDSDFTVVRYDTDGSLDTTFGTGGIARAGVSSSPSFPNHVDNVSAVAIQIDGGIVVAGWTFANGGQTDYAVMRFQGPPPHTATFFLHGNDVPGTAGGFTMNQTAPSTQFLAINLGNGPSWFSEPAVNGSFLSGATFQLVAPCTLGVSLPKTVSLSSTALDGSDEQALGTVSHGLTFCSSQTITIPVTTPVTLSARRLKLTLSSPFALPIVLRLGNNTFLRGTNLVGVP